MTSTAWMRSSRMCAVRRNNRPVRMRSSVSVTAKCVNHQVRKPYRPAAGTITASAISRVMVVSFVSCSCAWFGSCTAHPMTTATGAHARRNGVTGCNRRSTTGACSRMTPAPSGTSFSAPGVVTAPPIGPRPAR